jgi:hypothetical protein
MEQIDILRHTVDVLERLAVPYLIVGSFASIAYGESRFTQDIDVVIAFPPLINCSSETWLWICPALRPRSARVGSGCLAYAIGD